MAISLPQTETEVTSLRPSDCPRRNPKSRIHEFLMEDIREDILLEAELLLLSFATGIQDAAAWPDYKCFASNQTGNTLFLAIGVAGLTHNQYSIPNIGVSLSMFVAGGFILGQLGNFIGVRKRLWLLISNLIQTALVFLRSYRPILLAYSKRRASRDGSHWVIGIFIWWTSGYGSELEDH